METHVCSSRAGASRHVGPWNSVASQRAPRLNEGIVFQKVKGRMTKENTFNGASAYTCVQTHMQMNLHILGGGKESALNCLLAGIKRGTAPLRNSGTEEKE